MLGTIDDPRTQETVSELHEDATEANSEKEKRKGQTFLGLVLV